MILQLDSDQGQVWVLRIQSLDNLHYRALLVAESDRQLLTLRVNPPQNVSACQNQAGPHEEAGSNASPGYLYTSQ